MFENMSQKVMNPSNTMKNLELHNAIPLNSNVHNHTVTHISNDIHNETVTNNSNNSRKYVTYFNITFGKNFNGNPIKFLEELPASFKKMVEMHSDEEEKKETSTKEKREKSSKCLGDFSKTLEELTKSVNNLQTENAKKLEENRLLKESIELLKKENAELRTKDKNETKEHLNDEEKQPCDEPSKQQKSWDFKVDKLF